MAPTGLIGDTSFVIGKDNALYSSMAVQVDDKNILICGGGTVRLALNASWVKLTFQPQDDGPTRLDKCHRYQLGIGWTKDFNTLPTSWNSAGITMVPRVANNFNSENIVLTFRWDPTKLWSLGESMVLQILMVTLMTVSVSNLLSSFNVSHRKEKLTHMSSFKVGFLYQPQKSWHGSTSLFVSFPFSIRHVLWAMSSLKVDTGRNLSKRSEWG